MKKRLWIYILIALTVLLATYTMTIINLDTSYYDKWKWIEYTSFVLTFILPLFIILMFFRKLTILIVWIIDIIISLIIIYGICSVGLIQMLSHYLPWTILYIISVYLLSRQLYKNYQNRNLDELKV